MTIELEDSVRLRLSVQRALLGHIPGNLAGVFIHLEGKQIMIAAYFFNEVATDDRENIEVVATEVIADFPSEYTIETYYGHLIDMKVRSAPGCVFLRSEALI